MVKISVIIPTLNEAICLPLLLKSIKKQKFTDYEIIVADANSTDKTIEIAHSFGAIVVPGGLPSVGRNRGAAVAQGEYLYFLDSDVILPENFLQDSYEHLQSHQLKVASCNYLPISDLYIDKFLHALAFRFMKATQKAWPHAPGFCIFVERKLFNNINGFDESLRIAEDNEFIKRAAKYAKFRVLDPQTSVNVSVRRLEKEGRLVILIKYMYVGIYRIRFGEPKTEIVNYEFGNFSHTSEEKKYEKVRAFESKLIYLDKKISRFINKIRR